MDLSWVQIASLFGAGLLAGIINISAGGGSLITLPLLVFLGMSGPVANGTNRIAILLQNAMAVGTFRNQGYSDWPLSIKLAACALPGALLGSWFGVQLSGVWFNIVLAVIMLGVLGWMIYRSRTSADHNPPGQPNRPAWLAYLLMFGAGLYGGFIQAGVGFIFIASLHGAMGLNLVRVNMHKVFVVGIYTLVALAVFALNGRIHWIAGLILALGNMTGAWTGSMLSVKKGEAWIRPVLYIMLVIFALRLLYISLFGG